MHYRQPKKNYPQIQREALTQHSRLKSHCRVPNFRTTNRLLAASRQQKKGIHSKWSFDSFGLRFSHLLHQSRQFCILWLCIWGLAFVILISTHEQPDEDDVIESMVNNMEGRFVEKHVGFCYFCATNNFSTTDDTPIMACLINRMICWLNIEMAPLYV